MSLSSIATTEPYKPRPPTFPASNAYCFALARPAILTNCGTPLMLTSSAEPTSFVINSSTQDCATDAFIMIEPFSATSAPVLLMAAAKSASFTAIDTRSESENVSVTRSLAPKTIEPTRAVISPAFSISGDTRPINPPVRLPWFRIFPPVPEN